MWNSAIVNSFEFIDIFWILFLVVLFSAVEYDIDWPGNGADKWWKTENRVESWSVVSIDDM